MAPFLSRLRRSAPAPGGPVTDAVEPAGPPPPARRPLPHPGHLRRERRALLRVREERLRDLGGLALEMYRRDQFREDLLFEQCSELMALEERLFELDSLLATAAAVRQTPRGARCECGAPILWGSRFCANCGRPLVEPEPEAGPNGAQEPDAAAAPPEPAPAAEPEGEGA